MKRISNRYSIDMCYEDRLDNQWRFAADSNICNFPTTLHFPVSTNKMLNCQLITLSLQQIFIKTGKMIKAHTFCIFNYDFFEQERVRT